MLEISTTLTKAELLSAVPQKSVVDSLVALWFNSSDPLLRESDFSDPIQRLIGIDAAQL